MITSASDSNITYFDLPLPPIGCRRVLTLFFRLVGAGIGAAVDIADPSLYIASDLAEIRAFMRSTASEACFSSTPTFSMRLLLKQIPSSMWFADDTEITTL